MKSDFLSRGALDHVVGKNMNMYNKEQELREEVKYLKKKIASNKITDVIVSVALVGQWIWIWWLL